MAASDDLPQSRDRLSLAGSGVPGPRVPRVLEQALDVLQDLGLSPSLLERFTRFWKRHGLGRALILLLAITLPLWRYVWIPSAVSTGLGAMAEALGAELSVGDWSADWYDIAVKGEDVRIDAQGPYTESWFLTADEIELDWSLVRGMGNTLARARALVGAEKPPDEPVHVIRVRDGSLHFERLISGRWNWQDAVSTSSIAALATTGGRFRVPRLEADKLQLSWVEHLPGESGGGLIEQKTSELSLTKVTLKVTDLLVPEDTRDNPTEYSISGYSADGHFAATGHLNFARWMMGSRDAAPVLLPPGPGLRKVSATEPGAAWMPSFTASIELNNIGAAALARIVASDASLVPVTGTMTGHIELSSADGLMTCAVDVEMRNVSYAANPRSNYVRMRRAEVERGVAGLVVNKTINRKCSGVNWNSPEVRVASVLHAEITGDAVKEAAPIVQAAAGYDRLRFVAMDPQARSGNITADVSERIGRAIGGEHGGAIAVELAKPDASGQSPVTRGIKGIGKGIKRLFGGGSK